MGLGVGARERDVHSLVALEVIALIHGEAAGAAAEAVALGAEFASVADFAEELTVVLRAVCRVEQLAAETAFEAHFVPFESTGYALLRCVDRLATLGTLGLFNWLVRHFVCLFCLLSTQQVYDRG